jgi:Holliday junction DNA helicase RuvB
MSEATSFDESIRPSRWEDYVGQVKMKSRLQIGIDPAIKQRRAMEHILMIEGPGTGKTTLAGLIADQYGEEFKAIQMPVNLERFIDVIEEFEGVLLLDELHAAPTKFQEMLQPALLDGVFTCPDGYEIDVSGILFIGATVPEFQGKVVAPLQQRFEIQPVWEPYSLEETAEIICGMATRLGFSIDPDVAAGLAGACSGTPRLAKRFVKAARDLGAVGHEVSVASVLDHVGVDANGLGADHMEYMQILRTQRRAGLKNLANWMGKPTTAVEDLERALVTGGFVQLTSTGRRLTPAGKAKLANERQGRAA